MFAYLLFTCITSNSYSNYGDVCTFSVQLRQSLDALLNQLKNFQARLRQYASYEFVQRLLKGYLKVRGIIFSTNHEVKIPNTNGG